MFISLGTEFYGVFWKLYRLGIFIKQTGKKYKIEVWFFKKLIKQKLHSSLNYLPEGQIISDNWTDYNL